MFVAHVDFSSRVYCESENVAYVCLNIRDTGIVDKFKKKCRRQL